MMYIFALAAAQAAAPQPAVQPAPPAKIAAPAATVAPAAPATLAPAAPAEPVAAIVAQPSQNVLHAGVEVPLRLDEGLDSNDKTIREGQQFHLSVANNVMLGNMVVIPAGSPAIAEITDLRRKGMWGKSGHIVARVLNVRVGDRLVRLTGNFDEHGTTGTAGVVAAIAFVPIAGFFMTGTSAKIPAGAGVKAFLDEDLTIAAPPPPAPVVAPAPAAALASGPSAPVTAASAAAGTPAIASKPAAAPATTQH